ncbi:hypothetical protein BDB00DRAFT_848793 [Zychaea mexicana]|uniref:uncharacterized protein n=1 Tax=Zychaea mexicana TaxID=64656 RepID=UPI0022FED904|nr:uncharacterized protein BDB00DRAFT_848793 [Zychaea mexicana]KAI9488341.1 hypothetical protein BDB00DRAFT_848793 [Zychaea mexicana]
MGEAGGLKTQETRSHKTEWYHLLKFFMIFKRRHHIRAVCTSCQPSTVSTLLSQPLKLN